MLTHEEQQAMIMFDRLLMLAKDNDTLADLLDQTLNVARMIDPRLEDKIVYGPLQRMHFEWQDMKSRMDHLDKKMEQYIASQNRYGTPNPWPSNPGFSYPPGTGTIGYPQGVGTGIGTTTTSGTGSHYPGYGAVPPMTWDTQSQINPISMEEIKKMLAAHAQSIDPSSDSDAK